jgi:hypothetical protein
MTFCRDPEALTPTVAANKERRSSGFDSSTVFGSFLYFYTQEVLKMFEQFFERSHALIRQLDSGI